MLFWGLVVVVVVLVGGDGGDDGFSVAVAIVPVSFMCLCRMLF